MLVLFLSIIFLSKIYFENNQIRKKAKKNADKKQIKVIYNIDFYKSHKKKLKIKYKDTKLRFYKEIFKGQLFRKEC